MAMRVVQKIKDIWDVLEEGRGRETRGKMQKTFLWEEPVQDGFVQIQEHWK